MADQPGPDQPGEGRPREGQPGKGQPGASSRAPGNAPSGRSRGEAVGEDSDASGSPGNARTAPGGAARNSGSNRSRPEGTGGEPTAGGTRRRPGSPADLPGEPSLADPLDPALPTSERAEEALHDLAAPFSGGDFRQFVDRLRDVEELMDDPRLRAEAARIRERARALRAESQRHSTAPRWDLIRGEIARPLAELSQQVSEELLRRTSRESVVPLDRTPPPPGYSEKVRRYYERLGRGE